ncbi:MAG: hypothetical protein HC919_15195 [Oscillatoriales cyanobacterium SM2_2_1]|nr:hypothetical protein [Oscillatoriales cyanobacterium SM2_2_1]
MRLTAPPPITPLPTSQGCRHQSTGKPNPSNVEEGRYVVIVPSTAPVMLQRVRTLAPSAEIRSSSRGPYIEVRRYADRASAETLSNTMRQQGLDARVTYF